MKDIAGQNILKNTTSTGEQSLIVSVRSSTVPV